MILAGRRLNDNMGLYVAGQIVQLHGSQSASTSRARACWCSGSPSRRTAPTSAIPRSSTSCASSQKYGAQGRRLRSLGRSRPRREHEYGLDLIARAQAGASTTPSSWRWRTSEFREHGRRAAYARLCRRPHVLYDIKHVFPSRLKTDGAACMKILVTGAAGFIGCHDRAAAARARRRGRRPRQSERLLRRHAQGRAPGSPHGACPASAS